MSLSLSKGELVIRRAVDDDIITISDIMSTTLKQIFIDDSGDLSVFSPDFLRKSQEITTILVAEVASSVVGFIQYQANPPDFTINALALMPEFQRSGIGTMLFTKAMYDAKESCNHIIISVQPSNKSVWHLYLRLGFKEQGGGAEWNSVLSMDIKQVWRLLKNRNE